MKLIFKNPTIKTDYEFSKKMEGLSIEESSRLWKRHNLTEERMAFLAPIGYLRSFCEVVELCEKNYNPDITLDLTYETVKNLPQIIGHQYVVNVVFNGYEAQEAIKIAKKTLASYLMLLCVNEHMCFPSVSKLQNFDNVLKHSSSAMNTPDTSWMGFTIKVGAQKEIDLLPEVNGIISGNEKGELTIRVDHIVKVYQNMCGVDLYEKGFEDFELVSE